VVDQKQMYVATADGMLRIDELQLAGKKRMRATDFINGLNEAGVYMVE